MQIRSLDYTDFLNVYCRRIRYRKNRINTFIFDTIKKLVKYSFVFCPHFKNVIFSSRRGVTTTISMRIFMKPYSDHNILLGYGFIYA